MPNPEALAAAIAELDSFNPSVRADALCALSAQIDSGEICLPPVKSEVNLHYHTFFSYNADGWSPSRVAWEARKYGLAVAGIVDFDVLDGMEEFLSAGELLGLPTTAAMESRVFVPEYSDKVLSSPNEPGIAYYMAAGCCRLPKPDTEAAATLSSMREMARARNLQVMDRVNDYLGTVRLDYDADVIPLTPSGNATERHMLAAYDAKARAVYPEQAALTEFWSNALQICPCEASGLVSDTPKLHELIRSKLMKFGGVGYVPPTAETFPDVDTVIGMIRGIGALPMIAWLDGTNPGEADMPALLELMESKGTVAMNIIPDRNWNIKNPEERRTKLANLEKAVQAARDIAFPLCVGTEMNKAGLPFVDDFSAPELQWYVNDFLEGAYFLWGHTFLSRAADMGFASEWAGSHFGNDRRRKNEFYAEIGRLGRPDRTRIETSRGLRSASPKEVLKALGG